MSSTNTDNNLLKLLAIAIQENPRGTIKELAEAVGISKATLHRSYGTRENLENALMQKAFTAMEDIIYVASKEFEDYQTGLRELISIHYDNKEFIRLMCGFQLCEDEQCGISYFKALDSFFLNGQKSGVFRIDFSVPALSEMFMSVVCGMIDAERRGRVAPMYMLETIEGFILYGSINS